MMSERVLQSMMQLFALVAHIDGVGEKGKNILNGVLRDDFLVSDTEKYLAVFEAFLAPYHHIADIKDGSAKRISLNSVKILKTCNDINKELEQEQKVILLTRLLEFLHASFEVSEQEREFALIVIDSFNIPTEDFENLMYFVIHKDDMFPSPSNVLVVNNKKTNTRSKLKHICNPQLQDDTEIWILRVPSAGAYQVKLFGKQELSLNGQALQRDKIYQLITGSSIRSASVQPIFHREVVRAFSQDFFM